MYGIVDKVNNSKFSLEIKNRFMDLTRELLALSIEQDKIVDFFITKKEELFLVEGSDKQTHILEKEQDLLFNYLSFLEENDPENISATTRTLILSRFHDLNEEFQKIKYAKWLLEHNGEQALADIREIALKQTPLRLQFLSELDNLYGIKVLPMLIDAICTSSNPDENQGHPRYINYLEQLFAIVNKYDYSGFLARIWQFVAKQTLEIQHLLVRLLHKCMSQINSLVVSSLNSPDDSEQLWAIRFLSNNLWFQTEMGQPAHE